MIHYHGTPCSGSRSEAACFLAGRHALVPWSYPGDLPIVAEVCQSFFLDNGAFTAWMQGSPIEDWSAYFQWILQWFKHPGFDFAIVPDVIDGTEDENNKLLAQWYKHVPCFVSCAPVWHLHESLERLDWLIDSHRSHRICFGSSGDYSTPGTTKWWSRMGEAMEVACDNEGRPRCRFHGLRMLDPDIFHRLPLASADSTNSVRNASLLPRFGMYCPPSVATRQSIIAERIEAQQSAAVWVKRTEQPLFVLEETT